MRMQQARCKHPYRWHLLSSLILLLALTFLWALPQPALAAPSWQSQILDSSGDVGTFKALVLDSSGNPVISYYDKTNADLKLMHCGNPICTLKTIQTVDSAGDVGAFNSLALDSSGNPVISYFSYTNYIPKLVHCGNATCSSGNTIVTLDTGTLGQYTSLALDGSGNPVVGYTEGYQQHVKVAHCGNATCTSGNSIQIAASTQAALYTSLALDSGGKPVVSYYSSYPNFVLRLVHCGNTTCSSGNTVVNVDSSTDVGMYNAIKLDSSGNPVISYYDNNNDDLKLTHCGNANCNSGNATVTVDSNGDVGRYTALVLDSSGKPVISYYDATNGNLKFVQCGNTNCTSGNTFQTVDSTGDVGQYTALRLDSSGAPVIAYYDVTNGDLKLARLVSDAVAPTANPSQSPAANANGWNKTDVTVNWNWSDNGGGSGLDTANCPASTTSSGEGTLTLTATCYDRTGNATSASYTVKVDKTAPVANPTQSPNAYPNGWTDSDVTVNWNWTESGSGRDLTRCTFSSTSSGEGTLTLTATCQDKAGNMGSASYTVKVDKTVPVANPTLSPPANAAGWNNTNVTVSWNWTDPASGSGTGSGIDTANCETSSTSSIGVGTQTLTAYCVDQVGNLASASYTVKVDRAWPQILANVSPSVSGLGWNNSAVTVSFTCQEQGTVSGLATNTVGGNVTFSTEGTNFSATNTGTCTDNAGNVATPITVGPIKIDLTKPTISAAATTAPNGNGWYNGDVTVHFTCTDALSGITFCPGDQLLSSEGSAVSSTAQTGRDKAQNVSDASNVVTVKIDKTAPTVTVTGVSNGATYNAGTVPATGCTTSDALAGVATQATLSTSNGTPTGPNGATIVTATCSGATDLAGNSTPPTSVSYTLNALITSSVSQQSVTNSYNGTAQSCPSTGNSLPQQTLMPVLRNGTSATFSGLFFKVKTLEYTTAQTGQPVLCNATSGNGGVGSTLTIPNSSLPGGDNQFNPGEDLSPLFQVGLPVRAQFRIFVDLYAVGPAAAATDGTMQAGEYLGSFAYTFDAPQASGATQLFLPLISR